MSAALNDGAPFRADQLQDIGLDRNGLRRLLVAHEVRRVFHRVYVAATALDSRELRIEALRLVMPPRAVLYGSTAAWVLGVDTLPPAARFSLTPECVVPHGTNRCKTRGVRCVEGYIRPGDIMDLSGLRSTTPVRTCTDLLRTLRRPYALSAADALAHAGHITADDVRRHLERLRGYPGIVQARELANLIEARHESAGETWQSLRLVDAGMPRPEPQYEVHDRTGRFIARLDHAYVAQRVGVEYDGAEFHDHEDDRDDDRRKRTYLRDTLGWRIIVNRKDDVLGRDDSMEREIGKYLGIAPTLPRLW